jgi:hypothetical protein
MRILRVYDTVLHAVFRGGAIAEHRGDSAEDLSIGGVVKALEVGFVSGLVGGRRFDFGECLSV